MKYCVFCGKGHDDGAAFCGNCGRPLTFPVPSPAPTPVPVAVPKAEPTVPLSRADRVAVAAFVLSLLSLVLFVSPPLPVTALILALSAVGANRRKGFRIAAICISPVAILVSVAYWLMYFNLI